MQKTIRNIVAAEGVGIHMGLKARMRLLPAAPNTGIVFRRIDLPNHPEIKASWQHVGETFRCTCLSRADVTIYTVEHLLAAIAGLGVDNLIVELDQKEVPIMDGSAICFVFLLQSAGLVLQENTQKKYLRVLKKVTVEVDGKCASLEPYDGFYIRYQGEFDHPLFDATNQCFSLSFNASAFVQELSRARTFGFMRDIEALRAKNLILGGSTDNAVVIGPDGVINPSGLRYHDECVRHKVLDVVGDLALAGHAMLARFDGLKSGHSINYALLKALMSDPSGYEYVALKSAA